MKMTYVLKYHLAERNIVSTSLTDNLKIGFEKSVKNIINQLFGSSKRVNININIIPIRAA